VNLTIRPLEEKDNLPLAELIRKVFREFKIDKPGTVYTDPTTDNLFQLFKTENSEYFVAEENRTIIGGCGIYPTEGLPEGYAELVKFYLLPSSRRKGIGRKLMNTTITSAKKLGYKKLYLESFPELADAIGMYEKVGFKKIDHPLGNSGHYSCTIWMVMDLAEIKPMPAGH
jgi:putative acetyltransferase